MGAHLIEGEFQSEKYPTTPRGKVPLSVKDPSAQDLLWEYAQRQRLVDAEFSDDLESALRSSGYDQAKAQPTAESITKAWETFRESVKEADPESVSVVKTGFSIGAAHAASLLETLAARPGSTLNDLRLRASTMYREAKNLTLRTASEFRAKDL